MARLAETKRGRPRRAAVTMADESGVSAEAEALAAEQIDQIIERVDAGITAEKKAMDELLSRLRTTRIAT